MCKYINDYFSLKFKDTCGFLMEEGLATHSPGIHAWRIPMDRGHKESDTTEATQQAHTDGL